MKIAYNTIDGLVIQEMNEAPTYQHIVVTDEIQTIINGMVKPSLLNGQIIETATAEEIADFKNEASTTPMSRMQFWINVWRILSLTEENIVALIMQMPESSERQELLIMVRNANEFDRFNESLIFMARQMSIPDGILNQIFS